MRDPEPDGFEDDHLEAEGNAVRAPLADRGRCGRTITLEGDTGEDRAI